MVWLPQDYCIDSTEVTMRQYQDWLDSIPPTTSQTGLCAGNGFAPDDDCLAKNSAYHDAGVDDYPVVCVDWCDAHAYCQSVGKRLCGSIDGGLEDIGDATKAQVSQWHNACISDGATNAYVYGVDYQPEACNGCYDPDAGNICPGGAPVPVGSMKNCQSSVPGYRGVFDLNGNVWEWEDSCLDPSSPEPQCAIRGGSFRDGAPDCNDVTLTPFDQRWGNIGFRCCAP